MTLAESRVFDPEAIQHRTVTLQDIEIRTAEDATDEQAPAIRGYAAVFNVWADIVPGLFRERIAPGAFRKTIGEADVRALFNHNPNYVLGRNRAGTLSMNEDKHGLAVDIEPPKTQWATDLMLSMKRGDISQMSFGFRPVKWTEDVPDGPGKPLDVTLQEVRLFDVSVVTFPAYAQTEAWARSTILTLNNYLSEPNDAHSGSSPVTTRTEPGNHSGPEPNSWQTRAAERSAYIESLRFEDGI